MTAYYSSPVGILEIMEDNGFISSLRIVNTIDEKTIKENPLIKKVFKQLDEYFAGKRINFDLPIKQEGTEFQQKAWDYLLSIPYGETVSYKEQAVALGSAKGFRAIGSANGKNNIAIIVPCHRVINSNGKLGGYAYGLDVKAKLLALEQMNKGGK